MPSGLDLAGRAVIVTGASRGLGRSVAERLADEGCNLALCARRQGPLEDLAEGLRERHGVRVHAAAVDVTDHDRLAAFIAESAAQLGRLHGLVANAGGGRGGSLEDSTAADWSATFNVNVVHAATATRAAVPRFVRDGSASVVLVSSVSGWKPAPSAPYSSAKAATIHLGACLARELGPAGVRVNVVCPGSMLIPGKRWDRMRLEDPVRFDKFLNEFPGRQLIGPDEVAAVIAFLLSNQSRAVNGASIAVDGAQNSPTADGY
ncbi:MAG TPA: SDR family oxidoreductase [Micromonosporaceae bacterium]|nr:SDR family oxidoreductase [Micromonosporaceae bacterium]HZF97921.1 SDR family oxidoreductase [Pseudoxanthomonas sp.]